MGINWNVDNKTGADCSGISGDSNRVLTLSNTSLTIQAEFSVYASGYELTVNIEYTVVHKISGTLVTFLNPLWDDMTAIVRYSQGTALYFDNDSGNFMGSDCSGSDGDSNRVLTLGNSTRTIQTGFVIFASGLCLAEGSEYTALHKTTGTEITFLNPLWNDMEIEAKYLEFNGVIVFSDIIILDDGTYKHASLTLAEIVLLSDSIKLIRERILRETLILNDYLMGKISKKLLIELSSIMPYLLNTGLITPEIIDID